MHEFIITQITNGWILQGPSDTPDMSIRREMFLPTINAVADILVTWQIEGYVKAGVRAAEKYKGGNNGS